MAVIFSALALGGCATSNLGAELTAAVQATKVSPTDEKIEKVSAKLYKACNSLELAGKIAAVYWNSSIVAAVNTGISLYCQEKNVTSVSTALAKVGQIYDAVKTASKAANVPLAE